ncbi:MAG: PD40 domain-containing protein [Flavobacteriales bacterium]|nr:PD40 domain-containing protein [Flavobacteriales bacterium]
MVRTIKKILATLIYTLLFAFSFSFASAPLSPADNSLDFKALFKEAGNYMANESYAKAIEAYNRLTELDRGNTNIYYKLGRCHLESGIETELAVFYLKRAVKNANKSYNPNSYTERNVPLSAYFYLGRAYHLINKFDKAIVQYEKCALLLPRKHALQTEIARHIAMCSYGKIQIINKLNVEVRNLTNGINSKYDDMAPVVSEDETMLLFSSKRKEATGNEADNESKYKADIYVSFSENGKWGAPMALSTTINTTHEEVASSLSPDGQELFFYQDKEENGNIFHSFFLGDDWSKPEMLGDNVNGASWDSQSAISADGQILYFVSDRDGGFGGKDIYRCNKLPNGDWAKAENLGPKINTPYDEVTPFLHPNGRILFFSSNGHQTIGGLDVFFTEIDEVTGFGHPVNVGYPINSTADDSHYSLNSEGRRAYFSSFTNTGIGASDIYEAEFFEYDEIALTVLRGVIALEQEGVSFSEIEILVYDNADTLKMPDLYRPNVSTGKYIIMLSPGKDYRIQYKMKGAIVLVEFIFVPEESAYQEIEKILELSPIELDKKD